MDLLKADYLDKLGPLLSAEAAAEAPGAGVDAADLEQAVWVRLLESGRHAPDPAEPAESARWLRRAVRAEARRARRRARREIPYDHRPHTADGHRGHATDTSTPAGAAAGAEPEGALLNGEENRALRSAVARLPGRCPELMKALLSPRDLTYREIAGELGISQGSLGPVRSRCLGCLRRMLAAEVAAPGLRGKER
ncbi:MULTISPECIES: sigma-70 family RNA polymerase sigma factor [Streptomyces]|uniref:RNA polymerase sigma factor n=1 Tax=Streptomyces spororaveus TaxID=284039 RepID=A0ABQ3TL46_9ACTN|nr:MULTISPECIES: sigma-70 family RNA polymerase sigma factor [Streptomyces]MCM9078535.1 sigma-70 family RNA polymerase sigma factor [Streptomyces spororaveus]MCX5307048.1 sigma-70 family RNA polymerase sigma factor [Streptomyces sp. NBC_00160]GHI81144.1 RNA polymerase sigma factor [Streptomyces spororaveus]